MELDVFPEELRKQAVGIGQVFRPRRICGKSALESVLRDDAARKTAQKRENIDASTAPAP